MSQFDNVTRAQFMLQYLLALDDLNEKRDSDERPELPPAAGTTGELE